MNLKPIQIAKIAMFLTLLYLDIFGINIIIKSANKICF